MIRKVERPKYEIDWPRSRSSRKRVFKMCSNPGGGVMRGLRLSLAIEVERCVVEINLKTIYSTTQNSRITEIGCFVHGVHAGDRSELVSLLLNRIAIIRFTNEGDFVTIS